MKKSDGGHFTAIFIYDGSIQAYGYVFAVFSQRVRMVCFQLSLAAIFLAAQFPHHLSCLVTGIHIPDIQAV